MMEIISIDMYKHVKQASNMASPTDDASSLDLIKGLPSGYYSNYECPYWHVVTHGTDSQIGTQYALTGYVLNKNPIKYGEHYGSFISVGTDYLSVHDGSNMFHIIFYYTGGAYGTQNVSKFSIIRFLIHNTDGPIDEFGIAYNLGHNNVGSNWVPLHKKIKLDKVPDHIWVVPNLVSNKFKEYGNEFLIVVPDPTKQGQYSKILARVNAYSEKIEGDPELGKHDLFPSESLGVRLNKPLESFKYLRATLNWQARVLGVMEKNETYSDFNERKMMIMNLREAVEYEYQKACFKIKTYEPHMPSIRIHNGLNSGYRAVTYIKWKDVKVEDMDLSFSCEGYENKPSPKNDGKFSRIQKMCMHLFDGETYYFKLPIGTFDHTDDTVVLYDWSIRFNNGFQRYDFEFTFKDTSRTDDNEYNSYPKHMKICYEPYYNGEILMYRLAVVFMCKDQERIKDSPLRFYVFLDTPHTAYYFPDGVTGPYSRQNLFLDKNLGDIGDDTEFSRHCDQHNAFVTYGHYYKATDDGA